MEKKARKKGRAKNDGKIEELEELNFPEEQIETKEDTEKVQQTPSQEKLVHVTQEKVATQEKTSEAVSNAPQAQRQDSEDVKSVTSEAAEQEQGKVVSPPVSAAAKRKQQQKRRPLPGQSQYKVPGYKQTSRACVIS